MNSLSPLDRYIRDFYILSKSSLPFEDYKKDFWERYEADRLQRDKDHPILLDKKIILDTYRHIHLFKREGEELSIHLVDMAPNGGCGDISLEEATKLYPKIDREIDYLAEYERDL